MGIPAVEIYNVILNAPLPADPGIPKRIESIGDHIRRKRIQTGMEQSDLAALIGVTASTIWNWENKRSEPRVQDYRKIIDFLGYNPLAEPLSFAEKLLSYRKLNGLRVKDAAKIAKIDPCSWSSWERGEHAITNDYRARIEAVIQPSFANWNAP